MRSLFHQVRTKIRLLISCILVAFSIIICRLAHLQIHLMRDLFKQSQKNFLRIEKIQSPRGNILDCSGKLLVTNRPVASLFWHGSGNKKLTEQNLEILEHISTILHKTFTPEEIEELSVAERQQKKMVLASDLTFEQLSQIEEQFSHHPTIKITTHFERYYPYKTYASHILGYLSYLNMETIGSMGLEKLLEEQLKGQPGTNVKTINSVGRNLHEIEQKKALTGSTIQTTLDIDIQTIVETIFPQNQSGTFIIMDPEDGSLRALLSRPNFDPTLFLHPIAETEWKSLQENNQPFLNRAFSACYPPGSIFKLITISAALETNMIAPDATMCCNGYIDYCGGQYHCARKQGHGPLTVVQAVAESCNILFYDIGKKIDINLLATYAKHFGLGQKTDIIFTEKTGLIPTRQWKMATFKERWWQGETLSAAIGQSFILVTPIQVARMISSIFTGYLVKPRILADDVVEKTPLAIKNSTLNFLKKTMRSVVTQGTGRQVSYVKHIEIYAKTSTAQTSRLHKRLLAKKYLEHGWVVANFSYKGSKPLTMVVLVEHIGSSYDATIVAKNFLIEYKKLIDARLSEHHNNPSNEETHNAKT